MSRSEVQRFEISINFILYPLKNTIILKLCNVDFGTPPPPKKKKKKKTKKTNSFEFCTERMFVFLLLLDTFIIWKLCNVDFGKPCNF